MMSLGKNRYLAVLFFSKMVFFIGKAIHST